MIKTNTRKLCKAVDMIREKHKRLNDKIAGLCDECQFEDWEHSFECSKYKYREHPAVAQNLLKGEYSKQIFQRKRYEKIAWRVLFILIVLGFIIILIMGI